MDDPFPAADQLFLLSGGTSEAVILTASLLLVLLSVIAGTALRAFRWSRLERYATPEKLEGLAETLKRDRVILDSMMFVRVVSSILLLLSIVAMIGGESVLPSREPGLFLQRLGVALLVFLVGVHGIVRGLVRARPERVLLLVLPVVLAITRVVGPVRWLLDFINQICGRMVGIEVEEKAEGEEARGEILDAVSEGEHEGAIENDERGMIEKIIEFRDQAVSDVMTPRTSVFALPIDTPIEEAVELVFDKGHSRIPVYEDAIDNVQGILYAKDLLSIWKHRRGDLPVLRQIIRAPHFIPETKKILDLLRELRRHKVHFAVALDEFGGMSGIVTIEDILEEIVGDIEDEYDQPEDGDREAIVMLGELAASFSARVRIDEFNETLPTEIPEEEGYSTLGGFLFSKMGRVPSNGDTYTFENVHFEVIEADSRHIKRIKATVEG